MNTPLLTRRAFVAGLAGSVATLTLWPVRAFPGTEAGEKRPRLVLVILRGALDGLHTVPPVGDPDYARIRGAVALGSGDAAALPLDGESTFALNPLLPGLQGLWKQKELLIVPAVATPYRERSHFEAQDILETGYARPHATPDGWLNRALATMAPVSKEPAIAIGSQLPTVLRGPAKADTWSPQLVPAPEGDFLDRVATLYGSDPSMAGALAQARSLHDENGDMSGGQKGGAGRATVVPLAKDAARFLAGKAGASVAVLDYGGWDSHTRQFNPNGPLSYNLKQLDAAFASLRDGLGPAWAYTTVLAVTEFGRTVAPNGTGGTDHGTGSVALVLGGAVRGGRVVGQWPGLKAADLYEGRDLRPTTDLRSVAKGVLAQHLHVGEAALESSVFPDSKDAKPLEGLLRT